MPNSLFYIFSGICMFASFLVISTKNPVNSVLFLILTFMCSSVILFLLHLEFISLIFIIVYVGAIAVLFLFVVMMLNIKLTTYSFDFFKYFPLGIIAAFFLWLGVLNKLNGYFVKPYVIPEWLYQERLWSLFIDNITNLDILGCILYTNFFLFFLISGFILLVAMIGSITLTLQYNKRIKSQYLFRQLSRNPQKAIFLIRNIY